MAKKIASIQDIIKIGGVVIDTPNLNLCPTYSEWTSGKYVKYGTGDSCVEITAHTISEFNTSYGSNELVAIDDFTYHQASTEPDRYILSVDNIDYDIIYSGDTISLNVTSQKISNGEIINLGKESIEIDYDADWIVGYNINEFPTVKFTIAENSLYEDRTDWIEFKQVDEGVQRNSERVSITQKAAPDKYMLNVDNIDYNIAYSGDVVSLVVTSQKISNSGKVDLGKESIEVSYVAEWIKSYDMSGFPTVKFTINENSSYEERTDWIEFRQVDGGLQRNNKTVYITQEAAPDKYNLYFENISSIGYESKNLFAIASSFENTKNGSDFGESALTFTADKQWVNNITFNGDYPTTLYADISENTEKDDRVVTITVLQKDNGEIKNSKSFTITQAAKPADVYVFENTNDWYSDFNGESGEFEFTYTSTKNGEYFDNVNTAVSVSWARVKRTYQKDTTTLAVVLEYDSYNSDTTDSRKGSLVATQNESMIESTMGFTQEPIVGTYEFDVSLYDYSSVVEPLIRKISDNDTFKLVTNSNYGGRRYASYKLDFNSKKIINETPYNNKLTMNLSANYYDFAYEIIATGIYAQGECFYDSEYAHSGEWYDSVVINFDDDNESGNTFDPTPYENKTYGTKNQFKINSYKKHPNHNWWVANNIDITFDSSDYLGPTDEMQDRFEIYFGNDELLHPSTCRLTFTQEGSNKTKSLLLTPDDSLGYIDFAIYHITDSYERQVYAIQDGAVEYSATSWYDTSYQLKATFEKDGTSTPLTVDEITVNESSALYMTPDGTYKKLNVTLYPVDNKPGYFTFKVDGLVRRNLYVAKESEIRQTVEIPDTDDSMSVKFGFTGVKNEQTGYTYFTVVQDSDYYVIGDSLLLDGEDGRQIVPPALMDYTVPFDYDIAKYPIGITYNVFYTERNDRGQLIYLKKKMGDDRTISINSSNLYEFNTVVSFDELEPLTEGGNISKHYSAYSTKLDLSKVPESLKWRFITEDDVTKEVDNR